MITIYVYFPSTNSLKLSIWTPRDKLLSINICLISFRDFLPKLGIFISCDSEYCTKSPKYLIFSALKQLDDLTVNSRSSIGLSNIGSILESNKASPVLPLLGTLRDTNTDICSQKYLRAFVTAASDSIVPFVSQILLESH